MVITAVGTIWIAQQDRNSEPILVVSLVCTSFQIAIETMLLTGVETFLHALVQGRLVSSATYLTS